MSNDQLIATLQTLQDEYTQKQKAADNLLKSLKGKASALGKAQQSLADYAATNTVTNNATLQQVQQSFNAAQENINPLVVKANREVKTFATLNTSLKSILNALNSTPADVIKFSHPSQTLKAIEIQDERIAAVLPELENELEQAQESLGMVFGSALRDAFAAQGLTVNGTPPKFEVGASRSTPTFFARSASISYGKELLISASGSTSSFLQRIGRGSRRQRVIQVACFYRTSLEKRIFEVLCADFNNVQNETIVAAFRPSVAIQQIFSLLKQNPSGAVRLPELTSLFANMLDARQLRALVGQLEQMRYLKAGRSGEWRADEQLNKLADQQANPHNALSLYSNIKNSEHTIEIRDRHTHRTVARVDPQMLDSSQLTLEGRTVNIEWYDGDALWVSASPDHVEADKLRYRSTRQLLSYPLAQKLAASFNLKIGETVVVPCDAGWLWFHWLGDLYGTVLYDLIHDNSHAESTSQLGLCMLFSGSPLDLTLGWSRPELERHLTDYYRRMESLMDLGAYHHLLPTALKIQSVIDQFNIERFQTAVNQITIKTVEHHTNSENAIEIAAFLQLALQVAEA